MSSNREKLDKLENRLGRDDSGNAGIHHGAGTAASYAQVGPPRTCCVSGKSVAGKKYFVCQECGKPCLEEFRVKHPEGLMLAMCRSCGDPILVPMWEKKEEEKSLLGISGKDWECDLGDGIKLEMVWLHAGEFMMGGDRCSDEKPVHYVRIHHGFWLGKYPVTQGQYEAVMGENRSGYEGSNLPVDNVSWDDAWEFIRSLKRKMPLLGVEFRLPSEAEWEYSCRSGSTDSYCFGDDESCLNDYGWFVDNSDDETLPVGQKCPNAWGLYDMHGNVWEWCEDEWHGDYEGAPTDGRAWLNGDGDRVNRGGSRFNGAGECRSASRGGGPPSDGYDFNGFRLLRTAR